MRSLLDAFFFMGEIYALRYQRSHEPAAKGVLSYKLEQQRLERQSRGSRGSISEIREIVVRQLLLVLVLLLLGAGLKLDLLAQHNSAHDANDGRQHARPRQHGQF